jgi:RecA/RadA recombinase
MAKKKIDGNIIKEINEMGLFTKEDSYISTGKPIIDSFIGGYTKVILDKPTGLCRGKIYSLTGEPYVGKSTLVNDFICTPIKSGYKTIYQDIEGGLNEEWLKNFGLTEYVAKTLEEFIEDPKKTLYIYEPSTFYKSLSTLRSICKLVKVDIVVIDSFKQLMNDDSEDYDLELQSGGQLMSTQRKESIYFPGLRSITKLYNFVCIGIQQYRVKNIGSSNRPIFMLQPAGGNAYLHNMDTIYIVKGKKKIITNIINNMGEKVEKDIGRNIEIKSEKNRFGMHNLNLKLYFGLGISFAWLYIDALISANYIKRINNITYKISGMEGIFEEGEEISTKSSLYNAIKNKFTEVEKFVYDNDILYIEKETTGE